MGEALRPSKALHMDQDISSDEEGQPHRATATPHRCNSVSEDLGRPCSFLVNVPKTRALILRQEDTDGDERVTIEDRGPKHLLLPSVNSGGFQRRSVKGNYMVSTLLQELSLLEAQPQQPGQKHVIISERQLQEHPVERLTRMIKQYFWPALVRRVDATGLAQICSDPKNRSSDKRPRIYVPHADQRALAYFTKLATGNGVPDLEVVQLPATITPEYVVSINEHPGILALDLYEDVVGGARVLRGRPFIVPGGRFNEMYGWDSYFATLGLLDGAEEDVSMLAVAKAMGDNFVYQIRHYGKILNANRSYYLLRSQPPFLTDFALRVYERLSLLTDPALRHSILGDETAEAWLTKLMQAAIAEYRGVWMAPPRLVAHIGLSRYCSGGRGVPPETEESHFDSCLRAFAQKYGLSVHDFVQRYNRGELVEPELDEYFMHDGAVRESGHDTTYRLDGRAANLCTIDLCALLYKYESDIADFLERFGPCLPGEETAARWREAAEARRRLADQYLWSEERGMYFDYDFVQRRQICYESATTFWALWAGLCSPAQAARLVREALPKFEMPGGLVSGTRASLGEISLDRPTRQWDYPTGWAPHQMLLWSGLLRYGYAEEASRLAYRWLYMITRAFCDFNGTVPEKFDVVKMSHRVNAEYGNVGTDFKRVPREGFAWMNASYLVGMRYLSRLQRRALGALVPPDSLIESQASLGRQRGAEIPQ